MRGTHRGRLALCVACLGLVSFLASVSCLSIQLHLLGVSRRSSSRSSLAATTETTMADDEATLSIRYSCSFQRHIVTECKSSRQRVVASYEFLDEAQEAHPTAFVMPLVGEGWVVAPVAGGGLEETTSYATGEEESNTTDAQDCSFMESLCVVLGENRARALVASIPSTRFAGLTPDIVRTRYQHLQFLLQARLGLNSVFGIIQNFPQVLLYNPRDVEERLDFLLAPLPPLVSGNGNLDWPLMAFCGYGAGWTVDQVCRALQAVPHVVLALFLEDVAVMKPPLVHFLTSLQMTYPNVDQVHLQLDPWIGGDVYTFAYLKEKVGLEWIHLSVMLQAFPCLAVCDTEPTWEMLGSVRSILNYLQRRLQIRPTTVQAMIKTHGQLSAYSVEGRIQPTLNALQSRLGLSSSELRKVILRMPSLIGMSIDESLDKGLTQRLHFFHHEVGMTQGGLRKAVLKQPSLLQYSVVNLRRKIEFFVDELRVPRTELPRMIMRQPSLMGLSLEDTLRPTATALMETCGLAPEELGNILDRSPNILSLSWKRNVEPTLGFLRDRLGMTQSQLKNIVFTTPRVLTHSVKSSLEPKLHMIQASLNHEGSPQQATKVVLTNPALLVTSNFVLQNRLRSGTAVTKALQPRSQGSRKRMRSVLKIDPVIDEVIQEYPNARAAAKELGTSAPNMYNILQTGRLWKGVRYSYGSSEKPSSDSSDPTPQPLPPSSQLKLQGTRRSNSKPLVFKGLRSLLRASDYATAALSTNNTTVRIIVYSSGRAYPPDDSNKVRGMRRTGGVVLYFPQIDRYHGGPELSTRLRLAAERSFSQIMPVEDDRSCYNDGRILIGFPYLRPSRNRCELYACHDALKVVHQLLKYEASLSASLQKVQVDIYTDSDYSFKLLHNTTRLHEWGQSETKFDYNGPGPTWRVNPDLLHPLSRSFYRLVEQQDTDDLGQPIVLGKQVKVSFHHAAGSMSELHGYAKRAAMWMDQRAKASVN